MPPKDSSEYTMWIRMPKETVDLGGEAEGDPGESDPVDAPGPLRRRRRGGLHAGDEEHACGLGPGP